MTLSSLAIILLPFILIIVVLSFVTLNRYIAYKERVALARLGYSLDEVQKALRVQRQGSRGVLWGGVITSMSGLALLIGLSTLGMGAWLIGGLLPLFVGLGMVLIYLVTVTPVTQEEAVDLPEVAGTDEFMAQSDEDPASRDQDPVREE